MNSYTDYTFVIVQFHLRIALLSGQAGLNGYYISIIPETIVLPYKYIWYYLLNTPSVLNNIKIHANDVFDIKGVVFKLSKNGILGWKQTLVDK